MNKFTFGAAAAALALALPTVAHAQALPPAVVAVIDTQRALQACTVCTAASQQLEQQQNQLAQRAQQLGLSRVQENQPTSIEVEGQAIEAAVRALPQGQQPDAALRTRAQTYQTNLQNAQREIASREQQIRRNQAFVMQQIQQRMAPAVTQVAQQRGATLALEAAALAWASPAIDITDAVVAVVNQNTTPLNVNAPPPQQAPAQPQQQQRPQGR